MNKGRLFTFGCSMTKSFYPTWADILGKNWEYFENWAKSGVGNTFIFNSIIECDHRHHFTPLDTILILWTAIPGRHDYYQHGQWNTKHNAYPDTFNSIESTFNCPTGYEIINYAQICAVHNYLDSKKINYKSMTWYQIDRNTEVAKFYQQTVDKIEYVKFSPNKKYYKPPSDDFPNFLDTATRLYQDLSRAHWPSLDTILNDQYTVEDNYIKKELDAFKQLLNVQKIKFEEDCQRDQQEIDSHPLPTQHLDMVKNTFPNTELQSDTENWCIDIEKLVLSGLPTNFKTQFPKERF